MKDKSWHKEPIKPHHVGCLCCSGNEQELPLSTLLYNFYGGWTVTKNDELFFSENTDTEIENSKTLSDIEHIIGEDLEGEYIASIDLPLRSGKYQRQEKNKWILIEEGEGFA